MSLKRYDGILDVSGRVSSSYGAGMAGGGEATFGLALL